MRPITIILLVAGLVIAGLAAFLAKRALNRPPPPVAAIEASRPAVTSPVLVAARDLPAGTVLKDADVRWQSWPNDAVDRRYIVKLGSGDEARNAFLGATVRQAFLSGEPMMANRVFRQEGAGMMAGILSPGMRAIGIQVTTHGSAGGFILPGDRVDLILTQQLSQGGGEDPGKKAQSETVVRNLRVLAVDQKLDDVQGAAQLYKTVTLEVTPSDAEAVLKADKTGEITLALRSLTPGPGDDAEEQPPVVEPPPPVRRAPVDGGGISGQVKIYRGAVPTVETVR
ncbi:MAG: Flp pilus assembly protein CpaB [Rhodospirillales bacterium]|jgi:pilus assembly protein CpaB|nr:Flp pilus assembly protein CpaB [Rhodospirillales bacterium]